MGSVAVADTLGVQSVSVALLAQWKMLSIRNVCEDVQFLPVYIQSAYSLLAFLCLW